VAPDDLSKPLGQPGPDKPADKVKAASARLAALLPRIVAGVLAACVAVFALWIAVVDDPLGGEPKTVAALPPSATPQAATKPAPEDEAATEKPAAKPNAKPDGKPDVGSTVTIIDGSSGKREDVVLPSASDGKQASYPATTDRRGGDPRLLESTRHGLVPKIGADGARPSEVYARPVASQTTSQPRIAIVVTGLGIGLAGTNDALSKLPGAVTLAFAPYGSELETLAARARGEGHEILLQLPMEPYDYPDSDPGPQALLTSLAAEQNVDRLYWQMSRFQAYVGVVNYMGARFTATDAAIAPVLREIAKRGLIYLDDGTSGRSLAGQIAGANNLPFGKADLVIDAVPSGSEIARSLGKLEQQARETGLAIGIASALPLTIERIAQWAKTVPSRGFSLVPMSAAVTKPKSS
jgi:polysaccharide deacetylase 2 family uncharacterized protein YibQ